MKSTWTIILLLTFNFGFSCTCESLGEIDKEQFNQYDLIATGKILSVNFGEFTQEIEVGIQKVFKGKITKMIIILHSSSQSGMCGIFPKVDEKWLIYANENNNQFSTSLCTRTQNLTKVNQIEKETIKNDLIYLNENSTRK